MVENLEKNGSTSVNLQYIKNRRYQEETEFSYEAMRGPYEERKLNIEKVIDNHFVDLYGPGSDKLEIINKLNYE